MRIGLAGIALAMSCSLALGQVQEAPPAPRFAIQKFTVDGNTLLPQKEVDRLVAPYIGPDRDFGSVQEALEALQQAYADRGYTAVRVLVPEQDLRGGDVHLQVVEARVRDIKVEGNRFFDAANVLASVPALKQGEPPNTRKISQDIQLANENPAKQTTVVLEPSDEPGKTDATLRVVDDDPRRVTLSLDNTGTPATGMLRAGIGYQHANLTGRDDVLSAQFITSPTEINNVKIFGAGYHLPMYRWGGAFDFIAGYSDVNSGTVLDLFTVSGSGTILGARYTHTLPNIGAYQQKLGVALDYRAFKQNVVLVGTTGTVVPDITIHPISLTYTGRQSLAGSDLSFLVSVSQNIPDIPSSSDGNQDAFSLQRPNAPADYRIFRAAGAWSYALPNDFLLRLAANGQWARDPLVPGEQFGMGGQDSVRGFYEREAANDSGLRVSGEVYGPDMGARLGLGDTWRARLLGFIDAAHGEDKDPARALKTGMSSFGLGARVNQGKTLSLRVDAAIVTNQSPTRPDNHGRIHFSLAYSF
ncbi:MAG TPA: ShlB/FhaC/HecB family hemolysin secretion/activation protein [Burkholderiales bacterium]|nr:ShlB/FhaC/HecB family hemolysin secretion/activation protein [Burkholderiales bacterium]